MDEERKWLKERFDPFRKRRHDFIHGEHSLDRNGNEVFYGYDYGGDSKERSDNESK